jgi:quercetin 2,3-dioxygenase
VDRRKALLGLSSLGVPAAAACGRKLDDAPGAVEARLVESAGGRPGAAAHNSGVNKGNAVTANSALNNVKLETFVLGSPPWKTFDPFLFCVHHYDEYPPGNEEMGPNASLAGRDIGQDFAGKDGWRMYHGDTVPGFPRHPHRGFETVTVTRQGYVDHSDSLGATARYGKGDVQWMTAGNGIAHAEMFPLLDREARNDAELFQIWLNLPRKDKLVPAHFAMFWHEVIPKHRIVDPAGGETTVTQVAGKLGETAAPKPPPSSWASREESDLAIWSFTMTPGAEWTLPEVREGTVRTLYFFKGNTLNVAGTAVNAGRGVKIAGHAAVSLKNAGGAAEVLLLQGRPLDEPVVQYGPFVMNSPEEIQKAYSDFQKTQFGGWTFGGNAPVHSRETGRFARHADGRVEKA